jgi:hypothetical protein
LGIPQDIASGLDLFRTLIFDNAVEAAILEYEGPVIAVPVIGPAIEDVEVKFANLLYNKLAGQIVFESVYFVDAAHRKAFDTASHGLKQIALAKGLDSPEYKEAHAKEKAALKKFGQFGVAQPSAL